MTVLGASNLGSLQEQALEISLRDTSPDSPVAVFYALSLPKHLGPSRFTSFAHRRVRSSLALCPQVLSRGIYFGYSLSSS